MRHATRRPVDHLRVTQADVLSRELREAHESLEVCFRELNKVLAMPTLDAGALTSVRLKLAGIRLTRGPLITRLSDFLAGTLTAAEEEMLVELRSSHQRLLQAATVHTGKWTLHAIMQQWPQYCRETRELVRQWVAKAQHDQRLVYPLVQRCANTAA